MAKRTITERVVCPRCNGAGRTGSEVVHSKTGQLWRAICSDCNGAGQVTTTIEFESKD